MIELLSDEAMVLAKHPHLARANISDYSVWVKDEDRAIAREALRDTLRQVVEEARKHYDSTRGWSMGIIDVILGIEQELKKQVEIDER